MCQKNAVKKEGKRRYILIRYNTFNTFMYDHTLNHDRKHSSEEILKCHIKDCFKTNGK